MIKDFKGRSYHLIDINSRHTILLCDATGDRVIIPNWNWDGVFFVSPNKGV